jgi:hypothetical protein
MIARRPRGQVLGVARIVPFRQSGLDSSIEGVVVDDGG